MKLLLISNSTNAGEPYLDYPKYRIAEFLGKRPVDCLFIPYAGVTVTFDEYEQKVQERFTEVEHSVHSIHREPDPVRAVMEAEAIVVGGGNTFQLVKMIRDQGLIEPVKEKVFGGTPYIGWSAGSNMACPTIRTTNDMPILEPSGFGAFHLVPFQINPHFTDRNPPGHAGETREDRIKEFLAANPEETVLGLREGCMLRIDGGEMTLIGESTVRVFRHGREPEEMGQHDDFSIFLT